MSSTPESISGQLVNVAPAANADDLDEHQRMRTPGVGVTDTATGWDAYDVWRRFIKEARDRRQPQDTIRK
ncbi:MAG TPA: hypothetical protein VKB34_02710 [Povalibacter sp.]|nr:hypothetical protein [Povalibacter sp.]